MFLSDHQLEFLFFYMLIFNRNLCRDLYTKSIFGSHRITCCILSTRFLSASVSQYLRLTLAVWCVMSRAGAKALIRFRAPPHSKWQQEAYARHPPVTWPEVIWPRRVGPWAQSNPCHSAWNFKRVRLTETQPLWFNSCCWRTSRLWDRVPLCTGTSPCTTPLRILSQMIPRWYEWSNYLREKIIKP